MKPKKFAVLLLPEAPEVLFSMLEDCIRNFGELKIVYASSVKPGDNGFFDLIVKGPKDKEEWMVSISSQYILVIADVLHSSENESELGFRPWMI